MTEYKPIACSTYDVLESAAVLHSILMVKYRDDQGNVVERRMQIVDVFSKDKAEFLNAADQSTGEKFTLRLDSIDQITDGTKTYLMDRC